MPDEIGGGTALRHGRFFDSQKKHKKNEQLRGLVEFIWFSALDVANS